MLLYIRFHFGFRANAGDVRVSPAVNPIQDLVGDVVYRFI
jgi:hypothetical protein